MSHDPISHHVAIYVTNHVTTFNWIVHEVTSITRNGSSVKGQKVLPLLTEKETAY